MSEKRPTLAIIGGGASGIMAAIQADYYANGKINIVIFERMDRIGKKILATGNGRCNFSNAYTSVNNFYGKSPSFVESALSDFSVASTLDFFNSIGIFHKQESNGKLYPYSDQATAILDTLRNELDKRNIQIKVNNINLNPCLT